MRVLRLSTSSESEGSTPPDQRARAIAERLLAEAAGEPVDTVTKFIWPDPRLPALVERWLDEVQPDLVLVKVASYTVCKTSVAIRLRGNHRRLSDALEKACATRLVAYGLPHVPGWGLLRRSVRKTMGVAGLFEPADVVARIEACLRACLQREHLGVVVRAPTRPPYVTAEGGRAGAITRWRELDDGLRAVCSQLHIRYLDEDGAWSDEEILATRDQDQAHWGARGHQLYGTVEGEALVAVARELELLPQAVPS